MAVETELPRKLIFLMGGKAIQTKFERETYVMTNLPRAMYLYVYSSQDLKYICKYIHCTRDSFTPRAGLRVLYHYT